MRTVSGRRNRTSLLLGGVLFIGTGLWLLAPSTPVRDRWTPAEQFVPAGPTTIAGLVSGREAWLLPLALALAVLLSVAALLLVLAQIPTQPPHSTLRITDSDDTVLGAVPPEALERAMCDVLESIAGVESASVRVGGGSAHPWVQASVSVAERAETSWVAREVRRRIATDVESVLGVSPTSVDLVVGLESSSTKTGGRVDAASA